MPTLKMRDEREWRALLAEKVNSIAETEVGEADFQDWGNPATLKAAAMLAQVPAEVVLDLVLAYDKTEALGGRERLETEADSSQLWAIFQKAFTVVFPFVTSGASLLNELRKGMSENGPGSSPTSGASPTGISALMQ